MYLSSTLMLDPGILRAQCWKTMTEEIRLSADSYLVQNLLLYLDVHRGLNGIQARTQMKLPTVIMGSAFIIFQLAWKPVDAPVE